MLNNNVSHLLWAKYVFFGTQMCSPNSNMTINLDINNFEPYFNKSSDSKFDKEETES